MQALELKCEEIFHNKYFSSHTNLGARILPQVRVQTYMHTPALPGQSVAPGTKGAGSRPLDAKLKREAAALQGTKEKDGFHFFIVLDVCQLQARGVGSGKEQILQDNSNQGLDHILSVLRKTLSETCRPSLTCQGWILSRAPPTSIPHTHPVLLCSNGVVPSCYLCIVVYITFFL